MLSRRILTVGLLSLPFKSSIASNKVEDHYKTLNLLENYNNYKVKVTGGDINIATFGNKNLPPIILLHKLGGRIEEWRRLIPKLIEYRYVIAMDEGTNFHSTEIMLVHDGSAVTMTAYGTLKDTNLATFDADINGANVRLLITPASANSTIVKFDRTVVDA